MSTVAAVVVVITTAAAIGIGVADLAGAGFVRGNAGAVGLPACALPMLGLLKVAGGLGLLLGLVGVPLIGTAAAAGLVLFFLGAIGAHVRAGVYATIAYPGLYLLLAVASLAAMLLWV